MSDAPPNEPTTLKSIAPRLARARDDHERHVNRKIRRCSCGWGWRIAGHFCPECGEAEMSDDDDEPVPSTEARDV